MLLTYCHNKYWRILALVRTTNLTTNQLQQCILIIYLNGGVSLTLQVCLLFVLYKIIVFPIISQSFVNYIVLFFFGMSFILAENQNKNVKMNINLLNKSVNFI